MNLDTNPWPALHPLGAPVVQQWPRIRGKATLSIGGANTPLNFEKTSGLNSDFTIYASSLTQAYAPTRQVHPYNLL